MTEQNRLRGANGIVEFYVPGLPQPQGSAKAFVVNGRARITSDNKKLKPWRIDAIAAAQKQGVGVFDGPVSVHLQFEFPRPKGHFGTGRNAGVVRPSAPKYHTTKPDIDKLARACLDACTAAGVWRDDSQVWALYCSKSYAERPGVRFRLADSMASAYGAAIDDDGE